MIENGDNAEVQLRGDLTIRTAEHVCERLREALSRSNHLIIDCSEAAEVDLTLIQQLLAARRSAERSGGTLSFRRPGTGPLFAVLEAAGFLAEDARFWTGTGE